MAHEVFLREVGNDFNEQQGLLWCQVVRMIDGDTSADIGFKILPGKWYFGIPIIRIDVDFLFMFALVVVMFMLITMIAISQARF